MCSPARRSSFTSCTRDTPWRCGTRRKTFTKSRCWGWWACWLAWLEWELTLVLQHQGKKVSKAGRWLFGFDVSWRIICNLLPLFLSLCDLLYRKSLASHCEMSVRWIFIYVCNCTLWRSYLMIISLSTHPCIFFLAPSLHSFLGSCINFTCTWNMGIIFIVFLPYHSFDIPEHLIKHWLSSLQQTVN